MDVIKLSKIEAIALILIVTINQVILGTTKTILMNNSSGALLNLLAISILAILIVIAINYLFRKFQNSDIVDVSDFLAGKPLKIITSIAYIGLFFISSVTCLFCMAESLKIVYFQSCCIMFLAFFFIIPMLVAVMKGFSAISKVNLIIVILSLGSMLMLFFKSSYLFVPERAFPLLGYGADKVFFVNLSNVFAFQGISYMLFLQPLLKQKEDFSKITTIAVILMSIYLFLSVLCILLIFPFIRITEDLLSIYLLTRIVAYCSFIARIDAVYVFFWIFSAISYLSINLFLILHIIGKTINLKNSSALGYSVCAFLLTAILFIKRIPTYYFLQNTIVNNYFLILTLTSITILVVASIKKAKNKAPKVKKR